MTYNELKSEENKYVMNTYGRFPIALDHGEGATLWDVEGKKYIDLASGIGVNCLGYANPAIIDAIDKQAHKLMHVSNLFTTEPMVQVAKKLVEKTHLGGKVFFANSRRRGKRGCHQAGPQVLVRQVRRGPRHKVHHAASIPSTAAPSPR